MSLPYRLGRREWRLASGLVLFSYLTLHLCDHALGLVSLAVAEAVLAVVAGFWHSPAGTLLLFGAAAVHVALAFIAVFERRTLRMPAQQGLRIALGLWMPVALIAHFTATRVAFERYGLAADYSRVVVALWSPESQGRQLALLVPGWIHGCLGLKFAFGGRPGFRRVQPLLFGAALLLPVLAALGFLAMGRELEHLPLHAIDEHKQALAQQRDLLLGAYFGAVAIVSGARWLRREFEHRRGLLVTIDYPGRQVRVPRGWTVLEASRGFGIPHLSLCGGRARCSTCRVRVVAGAEHCPPQGPAERRTLERMMAGPDLRLACQLRPSGAIGVVPLLAAAAPSRALPAAESTLERVLAVVVAEFRRSPETPSAHRSAHDAVYAQNLFLQAFESAAGAAGGRACGFGGRGAAAVFGLDTDVRRACAQALDAMNRIDTAVQALNARLLGDLGARGELVLAANVGPVVMGRIGYREERVLSAFGPTVEAAVQLRDEGRRRGLACAVARAVFEGAGVDTSERTFTPLDLSGDGSSRALQTWLGQIPV